MHGAGGGGVQEHAFNSIRGASSLVEGRHSASSSGKSVETFAGGHGFRSKYLVLLDISVLNLPAEASAAQADGESIRRLSGRLKTRSNTIGVRRGFSKSLGDPTIFC